MKVLTQVSVKAPSPPRAEVNLNNFLVERRDGWELKLLYSVANPTIRNRRSKLNMKNSKKSNGKKPSAIINRLAWPRGTC